MAGPAPRAGTVLILVAGIAALLASLALSFLARMRSDAEESDFTVRTAQAHLMLEAACNYIQEAARLGWDDPAPVGTPPGTLPPLSAHHEGFGWVDVRKVQDLNDYTGPLLENGTIPVGVSRSWVDCTSAARPALRQPMYLMRRPPFAVRPLAAPNPIATSGAAAGLPLVVNPDPLPVVDPAVDWAQYAAGDTAPVTAGQVGCWFRIYRDGPATFVVTCGAGGTMGFRTRDWDPADSSDPERMSEADKSQFGGDRELLRELEDSEVRLWYRVEWSANVPSGDYQNLMNNYNGAHRDHFVQWTHNASTASGTRSQPHPANMVGTIRWVQRLLVAPNRW